MRRRYLMSRKRLLMSMIMVFSMAIATIVSIAVVFSAGLNDVETKIKMKYVISGVGVNMSATYSTIKDGSVGEKNQILTTNGLTELEIGVTDTIGGNTQFFEEVDVNLNSKTTKIIYEYKFLNTAERAFTIDLSLEDINSSKLKIRYKVSKFELPTIKYTNDFENSNLNTQAVINEGDEVYIYVSAELSGTVSTTQIAGNFIWTLSGVDDDYVQAISLDHNGGTSSTNELKYILNADLPVLYELPVSENGTDAFIGYFDSLEETATQYINADGTSAKVADLQNGAVLYAKYTSDSSLYFDVDGTKLVSLTEIGNSASVVDIPESVTEISDYAFVGSNAQVVNIPSSVTIIGNHAFENNNELIEVNFIGKEQVVAYADGEGMTGLVSIGEKAFFGCKNLEKVIIPETVTSIGKNAFDGCAKLKNIVVPSVVLNSVSSNVFTNGVTGNVIGLEIVGSSTQKVHYGKNLIDPYLVEDKNYYISSIDGTLATASDGSTWRASDYIAVVAGKTYHFNAINSDANAAGVAFYNSSKVFISGQNTTTINSNNKIITVPSNAAYIRLSWRINTGYNQDWQNTVQFEIGNVETEFEPYRYGKNLFNINGAIDASSTTDRCELTIDGGDLTVKPTEDNLILIVYPIIVKKNTRYTLSTAFEMFNHSEYVGTASISVRTGIPETGATILKYGEMTIISGEQKKSLVFNSGNYNLVYVWFYYNMLNDGTQKNGSSYGVYKNIQIEEGDISSNYESYISGSTIVPSVDNPQQIESFGEKTKNLFDPTPWETAVTARGITVQYLKDEDCFVLNGTAESTYSFGLKNISIDTDPTKHYTASTEYVSGVVNRSTSSTTEKYAVAYFGKSDTLGTHANWLAPHLYHGNTSNYNSATPNAMEYCSAFWFYISQGISFDNYKVRVQLEEGPYATKYEPYGYKIPIMTSGKNLINVDQDERFTKNADGSYSNNTRITADKKIKLNLPAGTYTLNVDLKCAVDGNYRPRIILKDGTEIDFYVTSTGNYVNINKTFTTTQAIIGVYWTYSASVCTNTANGLYFKNFQIEAGSQFSGYEEYKHSGSKNLFDINSVVSGSGRVEAKVDGNKLTLEAENTAGSQLAVFGINNLSENKKYTLSMKAKKVIAGTDGQSFVYFGIYGLSEDGKSIVQLISRGETSPVVGQEYSFSATVTGYSVYKIVFYNNTSHPVTVGEKTEYWDIQFEEGDTATEWVEYVSRESNIYIDEPLRKIGDVADYLDFSTGKVVRNIRGFNLNIKDMNNGEDFPGWKNLEYLGEDYSGKNHTFLGSNINILCNITNDSNSIGLNTSTANSVIFLITRNFNMTQTEWKEKYSDLVFELCYVLQTPYEEKFEIPKIKVFDGYNFIYANTSTNPTEFNLNYWVDVDVDIF